MKPLPCLNCGKEVSSEDAQLFAGVFVCPTCDLFAKRLYSRSEQELKQLLFLLKESIRLALTQGKLMPGEHVPLDDLPKKDLLEMIVKLQESHHEQLSTKSMGSPKSGGG